MSRPRAETIHTGHEWSSKGWEQAQVGRKRPSRGFIERHDQEPVADDEEPRYLVDVRVIRSEPRGGGVPLFKLGCVFTDRDLTRFTYRWLRGIQQADGEIIAKKSNDYVTQISLDPDYGEKSPPSFQQLDEAVILAQYRRVLREAHDLDLPELIADGNGDSQLSEEVAQFWDRYDIPFEWDTAIKVRLSGLQRGSWGDGHASDTVVHLHVKEPFKEGRLSRDADSFLCENDSYVPMDGREERHLKDGERVVPPVTCETCLDRMERWRREEVVTDGGSRRTSGTAHYSETKIDTVTSWEDDDPRQEPVTRYQNVRCPECNRMLFCLRWEAVGYPEVHCPACGFREYWPFESHPEWRTFYESGFRQRRGSA